MDTKLRLNMSEKFWPLHSNETVDSNYMFYIPKVKGFRMVSP
jgi:hypothetical protein